MTPTADEWEELATLLDLRKTSWEERDIFSETPIKALADRLASVHLEDIARRKDAAGKNNAWQWMQAHHGYKAFRRSAWKQLERDRVKRGEAQQDSDGHAYLAAHYRERVEAFTRHGKCLIANHPSVLGRDWEPLDMRWAQSVASSAADATNLGNWVVRHKALCDARKYVRKAREAIARVLPPDTTNDVPHVASEHIQRVHPSIRELRGGLGRDRDLEEVEKRLDDEIKDAATMKTRNGQIRWFLQSLHINLGTRLCGTTAGLRRLIELVDPESSVSDDTIGRIRKEALKREARNARKSAT